MTATTTVATVKYADAFCRWLADLGYTHCFFVAGGNIMHLLDGARKTFTCVPFVHEVAAGIAAEYYNESEGPGRAFALVTAGPGLTNIVTAVASAWLESRELLVVGGQAKRSDLASAGIRQRGIQEIVGRDIVAPITVRSERMEEPWTKARVVEAVLAGRRGRPGPVFIEICLDAQGALIDPEAYESDVPEVWTGASAERVLAAREAVPRIVAALKRANRPVLLIGGGVSRRAARRLAGSMRRTGIPLMTTWNGADRVESGEPAYLGRPNTWGQRSSNIILQQSDCVVALGTRLGLQQTGFNWQQFGRHAFIVQVDIDRAELEKGHPRVDLSIEGDADTVLEGIVAEAYDDYASWRAYGREVREMLPLNEPTNATSPGYLSPYTFYEQLSAAAAPEDVLIPCSSGGANSTAMQTIQQRGQTVITDKGLASMGIGLSGAIGAALAHPDQRVVLIEGDGGFAQNLQELATVAVNDLNIKIFIFGNDGYASIRMSQKAYFRGAYLGCDIPSGLGFPDWEPLFRAFRIPVLTLDDRGFESAEVRAAFDVPGACGFIVPIDPEQTYFPKITSRILPNGSMESNPLHLMTPELPPDIAERVFRYVPALEQ